MKKILKKILLLQLIALAIFRNLNLRATIKINKSLFDRKTAMKFPILIFGKVSLKFNNAIGYINGPVQMGMIVIGKNFDNLFSDNNGGIIIVDNGELIFNGACTISTKVSIVVYGGKIEFGNCSVIGCSTHIQSRTNIVIGDGCRISQFVILLDTNIHYMREVETGKVLPRDEKTVIGKYCWIGMRTRIMKGSIIPNNSIVAAGSLINKDMTKEATLYPTFAGTPAKLIGSGKARIFDVKHEAEINKFFTNNHDAPFYQDEIGVVDYGISDISLFNYDKKN